MIEIKVNHIVHVGIVTRVLWLMNNYSFSYPIQSNPSLQSKPVFAGNFNVVIRTKDAFIYREHGTALNLLVKGRRDIVDVQGVQGNRWILMPSETVGHSPRRIWSRRRFLWKTGFLELSKTSWKIHYSNLLCIESSSQAWNIKVIAWLLKVL